VLVDEKSIVDATGGLIDCGRKSAEFNGPAALMRCGGDMNMGCKKWEK